MAGEGPRRTTGARAPSLRRTDLNSNLFSEQMSELYGARILGALNYQWNCRTKNDQYDGADDPGAQSDDGAGKSH